jgi:hypothetical protein
MAFAKFMAGPIGRGVRILAGIVVLALGLFAVQQPWNFVLIALGVVFVAVGVFNVCLIAPIIRAPLSGKAALAK